MKQLKFLAYFAVVALLGFFEQNEILIEHLLLGEGDAIKARELRPFLIATPVSTGSRKHLYRLDIRGIGQMRATAQVGKTALCISGDGSVLELVDQLHLVMFVACGKHLQRIALGDTFPLNIFAGSNKLHHLLLDGREIALFDHDPFSWIHVVVKTVFNSRPDSEFNSRIEFLQGFSHKVCR